MMDSFKLYLPSNASTDIYPNNTPSNYQTHLTDPIQLQDEWEAGLESIFYSVKIGDEKENVNVNLRAKSQRKVYVTTKYPFPYKVGEDGKIPSNFTNLYPEKIVSDPSNKDAIIDVLNSINKQILTTEEKGKVFSFTLRGKNVVFTGATHGVVISISVKMSRYLGFGWRHVFGGRTPIIAKKASVIPESFTRDDFHFKFVDTNVLHKISRVVLKEPGNIFPKSVALLKFAWETKVAKLYKAELKFSKSGKAIIINKNRHTYVRISSDLSNALDMAEVSFGIAEEWAITAFDKLQTYEKDFWYIDIYSTDIDSFIQEEYHDISYVFTPRRYDKVQHVLPTINQMTLTKLKDTLTSLYNESHHKCELSLFKNHTKLNVGKWITLTITPNLSFLLGFDQEKFGVGSYLSKRLPATLELREQHLFILSDIIQSTSYGDEKVDVLQEFVHEGSSENQRIIEKRFHPISYNPVKSSYIENIKIQIVNEIFKPIYIHDSKTIVILHMRKRK